MTFLKVQEICKTYRSGLRGKVEVLKGVSFDVEEGEFFVILGPSGCGKSTLLNLIAGLEKPDRGEIILKDKVVSSPRVCVPPTERDLSMVFQSYALYPHMTVYGNMEFPLKMAKVDKKERERRVREVAELLKISHLLNSKPSELSGGERQRVALGRALVKRPSLILMDEPLSNVDALLRQEMRHEIKKIQRRTGTTFVYVTHDQIEAMALADRLMIMREGRVEQIGEPLEVYKDPKTPFVAGFLGFPPMNVVSRKVFLKDGKPYIKLGNWEYPVEGYEGEEIVIGIRPEYISLRKGKSFVITSVERIGNETLAYLEGDGVRLVVKVKGIYVKEGDRVDIAVYKFKIFL